MARDGMSLLELERKLEASLLSNKVQAEVLLVLSWYDYNLQLANTQLNILKEKNEHLSSRQMGSTKNDPPSARSILQNIGQLVRRLWRF